FGRARAHSDRAPARALRGRAARRRGRQDPCAEARRAPRARGSRRLPVLEPRLLHQRHAHSGGRRSVPRSPLSLRRALSPLRLAVAGLVLLVVAFLLLWLLPSNAYIFLPDRAHPV